MKNRAIVMGIAPCLEEDLAAISNHELYDFFAIGLDCSDRVLFDIQHVCTYHPEEFPDFIKRRKAAGGNLNFRTHSHMVGKEPRTGLTCFTPDEIWPLVDRSPYSGSSSYLGAQVAVGLGYSKIILAGCPMSGPNLIRSTAQSYDSFQQGWLRHYEKLEGKVRSMSGWSKELLGYPDERWLNEE
jgi:hypothetical protein